MESLKPMLGIPKVTVQQTHLAESAAEGHGEQALRPIGGVYEVERQSLW